jgi:glycosyltransferase involved in cell wall biosynthesis
MRLAMDARKYPDFGIGTYIRNLVGYLLRQGECALELIAGRDQHEELAAELRIPVHPTSARKYSLAELFTIARQANGLGVDLFHAPHYTLPFGLRTRSVVTIHDLIHLRFPEFYSPVRRAYARLIIGHACRAADAVIVDSEFTRADLLTSFDIGAERIHVIPLGVAPSFTPAGSADDFQEDMIAMGLDGPYFLYVGGLKPHKNVPTLLRAFAQFRHRDSCRLLISGENLWVHGELASLVRELGIKERVLSVPTNPRRLLRLYQGAAGVVIPSLYEGFGLPILEAMACGTPVIGARAASIPEVIGEGGMTFDPLSVGELALLMEKILEDPAYRMGQREYGFRNVARFSWEKCGAQTMEVYRKVAGLERR